MCKKYTIISHCDSMHIVLMIVNWVLAFSRFCYKHSICQLPSGIVFFVPICESQLNSFELDASLLEDVALIETVRGAWIDVRFGLLFYFY